jgi:hypothetical protein
LSDNDATFSLEEASPRRVIIPRSSHLKLHTIAAMTGNELLKDDPISYLSHRPHYIVTGNISVDKPVKLPIFKIKRDPHSSIGLLDDLSLELLDAILNYLDLR